MFSKFFGKGRKDTHNPPHLSADGSRSNESRDFLFKILLIGYSNEIKTPFLLTYIQEEGPQKEYMSTIGVDFKTKSITTPSGDNVKLQIWDTAGQERFGNITSSYIRGARAVLFCYDPSDMNSFEYIKRTIKSGARYFSEENVVYYLVGISKTRSDEQVVSLEDVQPIAVKIKAKASTCYLNEKSGIENIFNNIVSDIGREMGQDLYPGGISTPPPPPSRSKLTSSSSTPSTSSTSTATKDTSNSEKHQYLFKVLLMGDSSARKTNLLMTYIDERQMDNDRTRTIGVDFKMKSITTASGDNVKLQIWDTAGQERFRAVTTSYIRGAQAILMCYNPSDRDSFEFIKSISEGIFKEAVKQNISIRIIGVSMKSTDEREVSPDEVQELADKIGAKVSNCYLNAVESVNGVFDNAVIDIGRKKGIDFTGEGVPSSHSSQPPPASLLSSSSSPSSKHRDQGEVKPKKSFFSFFKSKNDDSATPNHVCRVVVVGLSGVGKTTLYSAYMNANGGSLSKSGDNSWSCLFTLSGGKTLDFHGYEETLPQDNFDDYKLSAAYTRFQAVLLCYDITDRRTFERLKSLLPLVKVKTKDETVIMIVGLKYGAGTVQVPGSEGKALADTINATFRECSGRDKTGVNELFAKLFFELHKSYGTPLVGTAKDANFTLPPSSTSGTGNKSTQPSPPPKVSSSSSTKSAKPEKKKGLFQFASKTAYKKQTEFRHVEYDHFFKILVIGNTGVGKSCLLMRYADNTFFGDGYVSTIGVDFKIKNVRTHDGKTIKIQIWDTSGQERFRTITSSYYRGAHAILLCYDTTDPESFRLIRTWIGEIQRYAPENVSVVVVGTKSDLPPIVDSGTAREFADIHEASFGECSSKTGAGVNSVFGKALTSIGHKIFGVDFDIDMEDSAIPDEEVALNHDDDDFSGSDESMSEGELDNSLDSIYTKKKRSVGEDGSAKTGKKKRVVKKADANIFKLALSNLGEEATLMTGDPFFCKKCGVMFNSASKIEELTKKEIEERKSKVVFGPTFAPAPPIHKNFEDISWVGEARRLKSEEENNDGDDDDDDDDDDDKEEEEEEEKMRTWCCEFCGYPNDAEDLDDGEIPQDVAVDYLVTAPKASSQDQPEEAERSQCIVFVVDVSGSMCVTSPVSGRHAFKGCDMRNKRNTDLCQSFGDLTEQERRANLQGGYYGMQIAPGGVTHISRLQCVQIGIEAQIKRIAKEHPNYKIGLITFSNDVTIYGDGTQMPTVVAGDKLNSWEKLCEIGDTYRLEKTVGEAQDKLLERLWSLEENGATALGPAMRLGVGVAGASSGGGSVIICTDGLANQGLGSLEGEGNDFVAFYTECAEQALLKGVSVSVLSIMGTECNIEQLSVVAERTRGSVERVDPQKLSTQMDAIVGAAPTLAYGVMAMVMLHKGLRFRGEMADEAEQRYWVVKDLGNVNKDSEYSFSYSFRPREEVDLTDLVEVPFQVQLLYTRPDGAVLVRSATARVPVTESREEAEKGADVEVIGAFTAQHAAQLAKRGNYEQAQIETRNAQRLMERADGDAAAISAWSSNVSPMYDAIRKEKASKKKGVGRSDAFAAVISQQATTNTTRLFSTQAIDDDDEN